MPLSPSVFPVRHFLTLYFYNLLSKNTQAIEKNVRWEAKTSLPGMDTFSKNYHAKKLLLVGGGGIGIEEFLGMNTAHLVIFLKRIVSVTFLL